MSCTQPGTTPSPKESLHLWSVLLLIVLCLLAYLARPARGETLLKVAVSRTVDSLQHIGGTTAEDIAVLTPRIAALTYTKARAVRALSALPKLAPEDIPQLFSLVDEVEIRYSGVTLLERYVTLDGATLSGARELLMELPGLPFVAEQTLATLPQVQFSSAAACRTVIALLSQLAEPGQWAARALFAIAPLDDDTVFTILDYLAHMGPAQQRAAEAVFRLKIPAAAIPRILQQLQPLAPTDAANLSGLLHARPMDAVELTGWLSGYFLKSLAEREQAYHALEAQQKTHALDGFAQAVPSIAEKMNNLHDITDAFGAEIGSSRLAAMSPAALNSLYARLDPVSRNRYHSAMTAAAAGHETARMVQILRQATAAARLQLVRELATPNIYVLLAHASEFFDSSLRTVLVPELVRRLAARQGDDLLGFLQAIDPEARCVADFLSHLAWMGRLTVFLPTDAERQQRIVELLAQSAVQDADSLIFFAATFTELLLALQPQARASLLGLLQHAAESRDGKFAILVRVVLQEYLDHQAQLLPADTRQNIAAMLGRLGRVDLSPYSAAPFGEWLSDGRLSSLSVFQQDDDGSSSYRAHGAYLLRHGYQPVLSSEYLPGPVDDAMKNRVQTALHKRNLNNPAELGTMFRLAARTPVVISWRKRMGQVELIHNVYVYQGKLPQERLLKTFLTGGHELFAQRGHSYWRGEQLLQPLNRLIDKKEIAADLLPARPRFISIGSCGGIRAYGELTRRFGNRLDILATIGTGTATINTPYNTLLLEIVASHQAQQDTLTWHDLARMTRNIFATEAGGGYIQPGSLPAILYKMTTAAWPPAKASDRDDQ